MKEKTGVNGEPKSSILFKTVQIGLSIILACILGFFIYGQFFTQSTHYFTGSCEVFNNTWSYANSDGEVRHVRFPGSLEIGVGDTVTLTSRLPGTVDENSYACFLTNRSMRVYVNNELRLDFDSSDNPLPGGYVKSHYMLVELHARDAGQAIVLECYDEGKDNTNFNAVLIGDKIGMILYMLKKDGTQFIAAMILFILALMFSVVTIVMRFIYKRKFYIINLAIGIMLLSLWFIFDSFLYQIAMRNYFVDGPMEYMLVMTIPFFFLLCLNYAQGRRHELLLMIVGLIYLITDVVVAISHFAGIRSFQDNLTYIGIAGIIMLVTMIATIVTDVIKKRARGYIFLVSGFVALFVAAIFQAVRLVTTYDNHDAYPFIVGMYLMLFSGVFTFVKDISGILDEERYVQHVSELKTNFLANMSHEIRTPVNAILGMNEMISRESGEEDIRNYSENIRNAGTNLLSIINDILDFTKIESGKLELVSSDYSLRDLIRNITNQIGELAKKKDLELKVEMDPNLPNDLHGDENRIGQVLLNIMNNAVKYTEKGSVTLHVGADGDTGAENADQDHFVMLKFEVEDTGIGIRPEDMAKLFNKFERFEMQRNKGIEGTGLGLAISNNLVHMMGGKIDVKSTYGEGSTFTAYIIQEIAGPGKVGEISDTESSREERKPYVPSFTAHEATILVIDDSPVNIMVVKGLLKQTGINVDQALSGKEGIELCSKNRYDLILLDHMMPGMDGIETLHRLKENPDFKTPVIALTANAIEGMREMYLSEGFDDYLTKPTKPEDLERTLAEYLPKDKVKKAVKTE